MPSTDLLNEAKRIMTICNACRYCEGFCAVYPAMELRRTFSDQDLKYLANLCHNCRDCYYACQYAPPHEFDLNVPKSLGELRLETYREFAWPRVFAGLFKRNGLAISLITSLIVVLILLCTISLKGASTVFTAYFGENAFYQIIPYWTIVIPFSVIALFILAVLMKGVYNFWLETGGSLGDITNLRAHFRAVGETLRLKYLDGGGYGCNYPDDRFSMVRRWYHHLLFYGFILCFLSTTVAAIYDHFLDWSAPYPLWSWPVMLGTVGGIAILAGAGGLLYLKQKMDKYPAVKSSLTMDIGLLVLLFLTSLTGLLLLIFRETPAMGTLLAVHLAVVMSLFIIIPYGKFVHGIYRYAALFRNAIENLDQKAQADPKSIPSALNVNDISSTEIAEREKMMI